MRPPHLGGTSAHTREHLVHVPAKTGQTCFPLVESWTWLYAGKRASQKRGGLGPTPRGSHAIGSTARAGKDWQGTPREAGLTAARASCCSAEKTFFTPKWKDQYCFSLQTQPGRGRLVLNPWILAKQGVTAPENKATEKAYQREQHGGPSAWSRPTRQGQRRRGGCGPSTPLSRLRGCDSQGLH